MSSLLLRAFRWSELEASSCSLLRCASTLFLQNEKLGRAPCSHQDLPPCASSPADCITSLLHPSPPLGSCCTPGCHPAQTPPAPTRGTPPAPEQVNKMTNAQFPILRLETGENVGNIHIFSPISRTCWEVLPRNRKTITKAKAVNPSAGGDVSSPVLYVAFTPGVLSLS